MTVYYKSPIVIVFVHRKKALFSNLYKNVILGFFFLKKKIKLGLKSINFDYYYLKKRIDIRID